MDSEKIIMWVAISIGGLAGTYIPVLLFRADPFGGTSIVGGVIGSLVGIWAWVKYLR